MKPCRIFACLCAAMMGLLIIPAADARPRVLEEVATLPLPTDQAYQFFGRYGVAIDGNWALVFAFNYGEGDEGPGLDASALLYRHDGTGWAYQGILGTPEFVDEWHRPGIAMKEGIAIVTMRTTKLFELVNGAWTQVPFSLPVGGELRGEDIEINGGRILITFNAGNRAHILRKINGAWSVEGMVSGHFNDSNPENPDTPDMDLQGERAVILNAPQDIYEPFNPATLRRYYKNPNSFGWFDQYALTDPEEFPIGPHVAMSGEYTAYTDRRNFGTHVLYESDASPRHATYGLQPADAFLQPAWRSDTGIERVRDLFATRNYSHDRQKYVYNLFRMNQDAARTGEHVFTLQARNGESLGGWIDASGNRVIVSGQFVNPNYPPDNLGSNFVRIYEVPTDAHADVAPTFGFETTGTPGGWQQSPSGSFFVARVNDNGVWRQPSTNGAPAAWLSTVSRTSQSIQSEIVLRTFSGSDRWVGLATRRVDDANYYYVTLRTSGRVELKRMLNGVITTLAGGPATFRIGTKVRLRLESIGDTHRVHIDDRLVLTARDSSLRQGVLGILMNRAAADFDNITASMAPFTTLYADDFTATASDAWTVTEGAWQRTGGLVRQTNLSGYGRLLVGARTDDQIVQVRVRPTGFAQPTNWVGLLLRYQDTRNHAYLSLQGRGVISLWKRTNGLIQQLATKSLPVTTGAWYTLRVEKLATETRVFVNDVLQFTTTADVGPLNPNTDVAKGTVGLITQNATAEYDDFLAYQP